MIHKEWLDNEYSQWIEALQQSTVHNFKEHPMVKRMLSDVVFSLHAKDAGEAFGSKWFLVNKINDIGYSPEYLKEYESWDKGTLLRSIYWAHKLLKHNPKSITEIGAGVGEFYAIIRALGYKGEYYIHDLPEVKAFQRKYLNEVTIKTGLNTDLSLVPLTDFVCSFYALGEFNDELKNWYFENVINKCEYGFIVWNPHSGANPEFPVTRHNITIEPTTEENIKLITW